MKNLILCFSKKDRDHRTSESYIEHTVGYERCLAEEQLVDIAVSVGFRSKQSDIKGFNPLIFRKIEGLSRSELSYNFFSAVPERQLVV